MKYLLIFIEFLYFLGLTFQKDSDFNLLDKLSELSFSEAYKVALGHPSITLLSDRLQQVEEATRYALKYHNSRKNNHDIIRDTFHSPHINTIYRLEHLLQNPTLSEEDYMKLADLVVDDTHVWVMQLMLKILDDDESRAELKRKINDIFRNSKTLMDRKELLEEK